MNLFRQTEDGGLDKGYLRICAVYSLMASGRVCKDMAVQLLEQRKVSKALKTVETWSFKSKRKSSDR